MNPTVTFGFWMMGKMEPPIAAGYIVGQLIGVGLGSLLRFVWGAMGHSLSFGVTTPEQGYTARHFAWPPLCALSSRTADYDVSTPAVIPFLYAIMVPVGSFLSAESTNPARTFGPGVISGQWDAWWIYWVGPLGGALASIIIFGFLTETIEEAKLHHFEWDYRKLFRTSLASDSGN